MTEMTAEARPLDKLAEALAGFQAEMPTVPKQHTATVRSDKGSFSYTYAGLADVTEAAMPLLAKHGLSFVTLPGGGVLTGMLLHSSGQTLTASLPITNGTPQQVGSALTYMRRYLLGCMTGLVTDDDDDGRQAQAAPRVRKATNSAPQEPSANPEQVEAGGKGAASQAQVRMMGALMSKAGMTDRDRALDYVADTIGRRVASRNELTSREASAVIDALQATPADAAQDAPR